MVTLHVCSVRPLSTLAAQLVVAAWADCDSRQVVIVQVVSDHEIVVRTPLVTTSFAHDLVDLGAASVDLEGGFTLMATDE